MHPTSTKRLLSLDVMRGMIMVLLMLESTRFYERLFEASEVYQIQNIVLQFFHHPWNGLRFWDLIQPGFMFIAGTALAYSLHHQQQLGMTWKDSFFKVLKRSALLFFWGVLIYAVHGDGLSFELWNVLTQLSVTTLMAFLIFRWTLLNQLVFSVSLLIITEVLYRFTNVPNFDQPFTDQHNIGNYIDLILMNKINRGGWVAINCLPTACHTIWGAIAGKVLFSEGSEARKIKVFVITGLVLLATGYAMGVTFTPIIKRIATSSFVLASGGWCVLTLAFLYWWIDVKEHKKHLAFFTIVGMNSLFIYLFFETIGAQWFNGFIDAIMFGILPIISLHKVAIGILSSLLIFYFEWKLCSFLYKRGIFIKI